jgi:DNA-binding winged helix-turn-helix (wHTH) protein
LKNPLGKPDESLPAPRPAATCRGKYVFGEFMLDLDAGFLRRGPEEVTLRPKGFEVLAYLVQHHGRLVSKAELIEAVWPEASVTDNSLAQSLLEVRRALADDADSGRSGALIPL